MLFTQTEFFLLFPCLWLVLALIRSNQVRKGVLLAASIYLYGYWDWRFAGLLVGCVAASHLAVQGLSRATAPAGRKAWLGFGIVINLGVLLTFKYYDFFMGSLNQLLEPLGMRMGLLHVILPVGISFFTFQLISYCVDVYRGTMKASPHFTDLLLYICFFPHVFAGPIVRASLFLPQLAARPSLTADKVVRGFCLFVFGFFQKVFIADRLSFHVEAVFGNWSQLSGLSLWLGILAFAAQIYCDFSGYTDMAVGLSRMMGYELCENFRAPYLATSIADFWRRWHISLSSWLRDYLYIPLGGSRCAEWRSHLNLMLTMVLGGLWHGAAWTFVAWGAIHGAALSVNRWHQNRHPGRSLPTGVGWLLTMLTVLAGWTFFRASTMNQAWGMLGRMFSFSSGVAWYPPFTILVLVAGALIALKWRPALGQWPHFNPSSTFTAAMVLFMLWLTLTFRPHALQPFVYFQF